MSTYTSTDHRKAAVVLEQLKKDLTEDFLPGRLLITNVICFAQDVFQTFTYSALKYYIYLVI